MNKNALLNMKLKVKIDFSHHIHSLKSIISKITLKDFHLLMKIEDEGKLSNKMKKIDALRSAYSPLFIEDDELYLSYGLIYKVHLKDSTIKLELFHPTNSNLIVIDLYEITEPGLFRDKKLSKDSILNLHTFIHNKKIQISKYLIETLVLFFNCLKDGVNKDNIVSNLEDKYYKSIADSKKYYTNALNDLKKTDKVKAEVKKKIISKEKSNKSLNSGTTTQHNTLYSVTVTKPSNTGSYNDTCTVIETIYNDKKNVQYLSFDSLFYEIKKKSIQSLEGTIYLFFQILGLDIYGINLSKVNKKAVTKNLKLISHEEGAVFKSHKKVNSELRNYENQLSQKEVENDPARSMEEHKIKPLKSLSKDKDLQHCDIYNKYMTNTNDYNNYDEEVKVHQEGGVVLMTLDEAKENNFDTLLKSHGNLKNKGGDTPKFKEKISIKKKPKEDKVKMVSEIEVNNATIMELNKNIEETKKSHLFLPPNEYLNIIHNTSELCHRKFFEFCFEEYFTKVFMIEKDKFGIIKIESIISYFYYIKALKNFLFTDENKIFYANLFFYDES